MSAVDNESNDNRLTPNIKVLMHATCRLVRKYLNFELPSRVFFLWKINGVTHTQQAFVGLLLSQCFVFFLETSLFWIGCNRTWSIGLQMCVFPVKRKAEDIAENYLNNFRKLASLFATVTPNTIYSKFQAQSGLL